MGALPLGLAAKETPQRHNGATEERDANHELDTGTNRLPFEVVATGKFARTNTRYSLIGDDSAPGETQDSPCRFVKLASLLLAFSLPQFVFHAVHQMAST